jgi:hypothetical protein
MCIQFFQFFRKTIDNYLDYDIIVSIRVDYVRLGFIKTVSVS